MKVLDQIELAREYAKLSKKFCMYISYDNERHPFEEIRKAAPYLNSEQVIVKDEYVLVFDTEEEMDHCFNLTVGDDGPTELNKYRGEAYVYALTIDDKGNLLTENT